MYNKIKLNSKFYRNLLHLKKKLLKLYLITLGANKLEGWEWGSRNKPRGWNFQNFLIF